MDFNRILKKLIHSSACYIEWLKILWESHQGSKKRKTKSSERHICLLAWAFPPNVGGGVFRPLAMAKYFPAFGFKVTVLAGSLSNLLAHPDFYLKQTLPEEVKVHRLHDAKLEPSSKLLPIIDGGFVNVLNTFKKAVKIFEYDAPGIVVCSGPPFHNFLAGFYLARFFDAKLVLDYRDDWCAFNLPFVDSGKFCPTWESYCLKAAKKVFFTTQARLENQIKVFPVLNRHKCHVIPNGWEPSDFKAAMNEKSLYKNENRFVLAFIGRITPYTFPKSFLNCFDSLINNRIDLMEKLSIQLIGSSSFDIIKEISSLKWAKTIITTHNHVSKPLANRLMMDASALLILNDPLLSRWVPGKLYEYIAAGPAILVYGLGGEIPKLVSQLDAGVIVPMDDSKALECAFDELMEHKFLNKRNTIREEWLKQHTREKMVERMASVLNQITNSET